MQAEEEEITEFLEDLKELGIGEQSQQETPAPKVAELVSETGSDEEEAESPAIQKLTSQWVPLELCFGIPLFNDEANRRISEKVR